MKAIKFRVEGKPVAKGRPRFARRGTFVMAYTPKKTKEAESQFLAQAVRFKPEKPLEGPLRVDLTFATIKPKSKPKRVKHWTTRPDIDNLIKLLDSLNGIFWVDDSQIIKLNAEKIYGESAYTEVTIVEVENGTRF